MGGRNVIAAGLGRIQFDKENVDMRMRQASFITLPADNENCSKHKRILLDPNTIICAFANFKTNHSIGNGDSGKSNESLGFSINIC